MSARTWQLAGAFDAGHIRGWTPDWKEKLDFHQLEITGHAERLEEDYRILREEFGLALFRDGAWLERSLPAPGRTDWNWLDRLAEVSRGQVTLSLCHYEWPRWLDESDIWNGRIVDVMGAFAAQVASRYRGRFAGYIPVVESGYWTAMMTEWARWWPARPRNEWRGERRGERRGEGRSERRGEGRSEKRGEKRRWWDLYRVVGRMLTGIARAVKAADPEAVVALSEPWAWHPHVPLEDQGRPFNTLLGRPDPVAVREIGTDQLGGAPDLLDVVGLNFYNNWGVEHGWPLSRLLLEARRVYPNQRIVMGETGNCHFSHCNTVADWLRLLDEQVEEANRQGAHVEAVTWAPVLTLGDFDWGKPAPGAWVTWDADDPTRTRHWDPAVAKGVRAYTSEGLSKVV